jgi:Tol biopolymer transport system component
MIFQEGGSDVYNAQIDPETGEVTSAPKKAVETNTGWNGGASFSPDGKSMAYVSQRGVLNTHVSWGQQRLVIRDLQTGKERELIPRLRELISGPIAPPEWSPKGDEIIVRGRDEVGHNGAFIINIYDTSYISLTGEEKFFAAPLAWSSNNKEVYYCLRGSEEKNGLYLINRESKKSSHIVYDENLVGLKLHPDGKLMALFSYEGIKLFNLEKNDLSILYKFDEKQSFPNFTIEWSPDGKWLYFVKWDNNKNQAELWRITPDGKDIQQIDITLPDLRYLSIHPDGEQLVFTVGRGDGNQSIWTMKNFLPEE